MAGSNLSQTRGVTSSSQGAVGSAPAAVLRGPVGESDCILPPPSVSSASGKSS